ncbi:MAG: TIGR04255 family protein [Marinobacter sp.]|uniref:TIGR04255 family protein n=1 Tax=Marinobacter sp. TaxID=50741 RepID=UPI00329A477A
MAHPTKLKEDAILEALCDVRLQAPSNIPEEVLIGWLIDCGSWKDWQLNRLPNSSIPYPIRHAEEGLRYQPTVELRKPSGDRLVKIGPYSFSYHIIGNYPGWDVFKRELDEAVDAVFDRIKGLSVNRLGLRYINGMDSERHQVNSVADLDLSVCVGGENVSSALNLNFVKVATDVHTVMTRIASKEFVKGQMGSHVSTVIDVDVFTPASFEANERNQIKDWIEKAHDFEKDAFFACLMEEHIDSLREQ